MTGIRLTDLERRRLIAALLSHRHLILSGPAGIGKCQLAYALALSIAQGRQSRVCLLQGHPWWAARTGNIGHFVELQTEFSVWRLAYFMESALHGQRPSARAQTEGDTDDYVACVTRMSPAEVEFYFGVVSQWLLGSARDSVGSVPIRLIGTYDSSTPPDLDDQILRTTALVHLMSNGR
ncbi:MAG: hypothetical protein ACE5MB_09465 [Anaerolineae bacterium]